MREHWTWPFVVDDTSMPHIHDFLRALFQVTHPGGPLLISVLLKGTAFTAREAAVGFAMGAVGRFALGVLLAPFCVLPRGLLPYVVATQSVPIPAMGRMAVDYLAGRDV